MLREQTAELTAELQQRQTEYEDLMGQKDDLNSQLQVTLMVVTCLLIPSAGAVEVSMRCSGKTVQSARPGVQCGSLMY